MYQSSAVVAPGPPDEHWNFDAAGVWETLESEFDQPAPSINTLHDQYSTAELLLHREVDYSSSNEMHGFRAQAIGGDFRSLPTSHWEALHSNFKPCTHDDPLTNVKASDLVYTKNDVAHLVNTLTFEATRIVRTTFGAECDDPTPWEPCDDDADLTTFAASDLPWIIDQWRTQFNETAGRKFDCLMTELDSDDITNWTRPIFKTSSKQKPREHHLSCRVANVTSPTPAWTGLKVKRRGDMVASTGQSTINRHGGASSTKHGAGRKEKPPAFPKIDGKHKPRG